MISNRTENLTRWASTYLMLESVVRAHKEGMFESCSIELPVPIEIVLNYLYILQPIYKATIGFQDSNITIASVIPTIARLIGLYTNFKTTTQGKMLCNLIADNLKNKFGPELSSKLYLVNYMVFIRISIGIHYIYKKVYQYS